MRGRKKKKSHNVSRLSKWKKVACGKYMTLEERSVQVNRQRAIILLVIIATVVICVFLFKDKNNMGAESNKELTVKCENGEYVGAREIDVREMSERQNDKGGLGGAEMEEEKLPKYSLYEETEGMSAEKRFESYDEALKNIIYPTEKRSSGVLESLSDEEQKQWNYLYTRIEAEENKKGETENMAELNILSSAEYRNISALCYQLYFKLPQGDMATRYGRNAGDALKTGLEEGVDSAQLVEDFHISDEGYVTSFHYRDCEQKLADGCYWGGENYYQFLWHYSEATVQEKEHCALMAYFYSFYGCKVSEEEGVQHRNDLVEMNKESSRILIEEYDYPASLFN